MNEAPSYAVKRRLAKFFAENLKKNEAVEAYVEDVSHYFKLWPQSVVKAVARSSDRREIEQIALQSGFRIIVAYRPGIIYAYLK